MPFLLCKNKELILVFLFYARITLILWCWKIIIALTVLQMNKESELEWMYETDKGNSCVLKAGL